MMSKSFKIVSLFIFIGLLFQSPCLWAQDEFGRFFTTPKQREKLEQARMKDPEQELVVVVPQSEFEEDDKKEESAPLGSIRLKGLVYRSNGKSTAWTNQGPSYEGNISDQYLDIKPENINPDKVTIEIPSNDIKVELKAGETYSPESGQVSE